MEDRPSTGPAFAGFESDVDVIVAAPGWRSHVRNPELVVRRAAALLGEPMVVVLSDDRDVRRLNGRHRDKYKPTNVLTFDPPMPGAPGELVLALGVVLREAQAQGKRVSDHLSHLVIHGGLHLLGYDHIEDDEADAMEALETRALQRLGVADPYAGTELESASP